MVIDAGEDSNNPYIVFEHVRGETLKDRIRRDGPLPISEAVAYAIEIAMALAGRPRARAGPPRHQAAERDDRRGGQRQGHRLRHRARARGNAPDRRRQGDRHDRLRLARAGARPRRHRPVRHLLARHRALRDADRRGPVQGRQRRQRGDEARPAGTAGRAAAPAGGLGGTRSRDRQSHRQGAAQPLRDGRADGDATSKRCSPTRAPARAAPPARRRPCSSNCRRRSRPARAGGGTQPRRSSTC